MKIDNVNLAEEIAEQCYFDEYESKVIANYIIDNDMLHMEFADWSIEEIGNQFYSVFDREYLEDEGYTEDDVIGVAENGHLVILKDFDCDDI